MCLGVVGFLKGVDNILNEVDMRGRVVVTGIGAISPLGGNAEESFDRLVRGEHGVRKIERFNPVEFSCKTWFAAQIDESFDPCKFSPFKDLSSAEQTKQLKKYDRHQIFALIAAAEAIEMAKLNDETDEEKLHRIGVNFSTGVGGLESVEQCTIISQSGSRQSPFGNLKFLPNIAAGYIASTWGFSGPVNAHCTACAAGSHSIADGYNAIVSGEADVVVAGGTEAAITPVGIATFNAQSAMSTENDAPEKASRPFADDRRGFVMGEGAAALVLEDLSHALKRGATILGELVSFCRTGDGATGAAITAPHPKGLGARRAMEGAIRKSGRPTNSVDFISAHATGTLADAIEIRAIRDALGSHASNVVVSATKSCTGHLLGASGALQAVFTVLSIKRGIVPFTRNLTESNIDPECVGVRHVLGESLRLKVNFALSNSFGFGGTNVCLAFGSYS